MGSKRSKFEEEVGAVLEPAGFLYEPTQIEYSMAYKYTPDFVYQGCLVECKGWFRPGDTKKYKAIAKSMDHQWNQLVFLLQYPNKKVRKGSQITMSQWCEKNGIEWYGSAEELRDAYI